MIRKVLAACALIVTACSPVAGGAQQQASSAAAVHPVSGLPVIPLKVAGKGRAHAFRVEVARTGEQQAKGLMFRTEMGVNEGMIFPMDPPRQASFWMRNTVIPLDLVFVGTDGRVTNIAANAEPYSERSLASTGLVKGVLELNGGRAAELGIVPGDLVTW